MTQQYDNVYAEAAQGQTILNQGLYEESTTQHYDLGHIFRTNDGRTFMYASNGTGAALAAGKLCMASANFVESGFFDLVPTTASSAIGSTALSITSGTTAITANMFEGGFVNVNDGTGEGHQYKIKSHAAIGAATAGTINLHDPVRVAMASGSTKIYLTPNLFSGVAVHASPATSPLVGIPPIAVTQSTSTDTYYFWLQTYGPCMCLRDATTMLVNGQLVVGSADGAIGLYNNDTSSNVVQFPGIAQGLVGSGGEYIPIILTLFP